MVKTEMEMYLFAGLIVLGLIAHVLGKLMELRRADSTLTMKKYFQSHPYQSGYSLISAIAGGIVLHEYGELTVVTAIATGYMADSIMDKISSRTAGVLR